MPPITASGVAVLTIASGDESAVANTGLTVTLDELVEVIVTGLGGGTTVPVVSGHPAVKRHWWWLLLQMVATRAADQYGRRQVTPIFRGAVSPVPGVGALPLGYQVCGWCRCEPGEVDGCDVCGGLGIVPRADDEGAIPDHQI